MLTRYSCGHVGTITTGKVKRFIRYSEIRKQPVEDSSKQCPNCKQHSESETT
jgi:hypothetical protein